MKKSVIKLILGSLVGALLMFVASYYFDNHQYSEEIYNTAFVLACTLFFYFSAQVGQKSTNKSVDQQA